MTRRVRVVQYVVSLDLVVDDGEHLEPLRVQPLTVPAGQWDDFSATGLAAALAQLQAQVDGPEQTADAPPA